MDIGEFVHLSPLTPSEPKPGNLNYFAPLGLGLGGPAIIRPWDDPFGPSPDRFYGYQEHTGHPFRDAPVSDAAAGVIDFDRRPGRDDLLAALRLMEVRTNETQYAAFFAQADDPPEQRYVRQLRIVTGFATSTMFAGSGASAQAQNLDIGQAIWTFIECEQAEWGTGMGGKLSGALGGDGDWAKEALGFGFLVENAYQGVYRVWSRAWLVTK